MTVVTVESMAPEGLLPEVDGNSDGGDFCAGEGCGVHYKECDRPKQEASEALSVAEATHALVLEIVNGNPVTKWHRLLWQPKPAEPPSNSFILYEVAGFTTIQEQKLLADSSVRNLVALEDEPLEDEPEDC